MDTAQCVWTPDHLEGGLYALWLSNGQHAHANWTISPPWVPKQEPKRNVRGPPFPPVTLTRAVWLPVVHRLTKIDSRQAAITYTGLPPSSSPWSASLSSTAYV